MAVGKQGVLHPGGALHLADEQHGLGRAHAQFAHVLRQYRVAGLGQGLDHRRVQRFEQAFGDFAHGEFFLAQQLRHLIQGADDAVPHLRFLARSLVKPGFAQRFLAFEAAVVGAYIRQKSKYSLELAAQVFGRAQAGPQGAYGGHGRFAHRLQSLYQRGGATLQGMEKGVGAQAPGHGIIAQAVGVAPAYIQTARSQTGVQVLIARPARKHVQRRQEAFAQGMARAGPAFG